MQGRLDTAAHAAAIAKVGKVAVHTEEFRQHLAEILRSPAFKSSQRSQVFLRYVVEHALSGEFDQLRERSIGVALFGRPAAFDTAEDAIVRVTASDVRKRLLQHYGIASAPSRYLIVLPSGSYVPEFHCLAAAALPDIPRPLHQAPARTTRRILAIAGAAVALGIVFFLFFSASLK